MSWALAWAIGALALFGVAVCCAVAAGQRVLAAERSRSAARPDEGTGGDAARILRPRGVGRQLWGGALVSGGLGAVLLLGLVSVLLVNSVWPAVRVETPERAAGLVLDDDPRLADQLAAAEEDLRVLGVPNPVAANYRHPVSGQLVAFGGGFGELPDPERVLEDLLYTLAEPFNPAPRFESHGAGPLGGVVTCLDPSRSLERGVGLCGWADRGTIGTILVFGHSPGHSAELLNEMRTDMVTVQR
ncbi:hypothetical protein [Allonocardiopsis opalescens]|uniref:Uncharacterized protein n=1 Tax=Allonocardiopsis opalescens TaxID=1144618 RepID=A0A2T0PXV8_9ACTN|nr:hypothetical protein [Allonocardiopsis opalescens]PRX96374.1 hypothetical protein CLV72_108383 [Allonocardiopsis opalescens]